MGFAAHKQVSMMQFRTLMFACGLLGLCATLWLVGVLLSSQQQSQPPAQSHDLRQMRQQLAFRLQHRQLITLPNQQVLAEHQLEAEMYLRNVGPYWQGQLRNVKSWLQDESFNLPQTIYFTVQYQQGQFSQLNLLGLPTPHVLEDLPHLFQQFSYQLTEPQRISEPSGIGHASFQYTQQGRTLFRWLRQQTLMADHFNFLRHLDEDDWQMELAADGLPQQLDWIQHVSLMQQSQTRLRLTEQLQLSPLPARLSWPGLSFPPRMNASAEGSNMALHRYQQRQLMIWQLAQLDMAQSISIPQMEQYGLKPLLELLSRYRTQPQTIKSLLAMFERSEQAGEQLATRLLQQEPPHWLGHQLLHWLSERPLRTDELLRLTEQTRLSEDRELLQESIRVLLQIWRQHPAYRQQVELQLANTLQQSRRPHIVVNAMQQLPLIQFKNSMLALSEHPQANVRLAALQWLQRFEQAPAG